jgi:murein DD-endopeptidase MepM/ murein hydrolase activator NlpD
MIFGNPLRGTIHVNAANYPTYPSAWKRPSGNHEPAVTQDFGPSSLAVEPTVEWPGGESNIFGQPIAAGTYANFHRAIDIGNAGCGYDVLSAKSGTVTYSAKNPSGAEMVMVDHGQGFVTGYVHLSQRLVGVGTAVAQGVVIGKTGDTGVSNGCHLHFFVKRNGGYVDPWHRLAQNTTVDPDAEEPDMPTPVNDAGYVAGQVAKVGNPADNARVRSEPKLAATTLRTIAAGTFETWLPTCWSKGDAALGSDLWLARWNAGRWEYTHKVNVESIAAPVVDCTAQVKAATDPLLARIAGIKAKVAAGAVDIADD